MKNFLLVVGKSLLYAAGIFFLVFILFSSVFVSNLGPIAGFIIAAQSFSLSLVIFLFVVSRRELRANRMKHAAPLTYLERQLLGAPRSQLRVAVGDPNASPAFTDGLIRDLEATGLFSHVGEYEECEHADVMATIKGTYWGQEEGQNFIIHLPDNPGDGVEIDVHYLFGAASPWNSRKSERRQYVRRLSVELIKALEVILDQDKSLFADPIAVSPGHTTGRDKD